MTLTFGERNHIIAARMHLRGVLTNFMSKSQRETLMTLLNGEEADGTAKTILSLVKQIQGTPLTYQTEAVESADKVLHLHYFKGSVDAWIVERDMGDGTEPQGEGEQLQAYGKCTLFAEGFDGAEWGYVSIRELIDNGVELDMYWNPTAAKDMK